MSFRQRRAGRTTFFAAALLVAACGSPVPPATPANGLASIPVVGSPAPPGTPVPTTAPTGGGQSATPAPTASAPPATPAPTLAPTPTPSLAPPIQLGSTPAAPIPSAAEIADLRSGLATEIAGLNSVQVQLIAAADANAAPPVIDRLLLDAAARAAAIGDHATTVALAATTAAGAGPIAARTAAAYRDLGLLAYLFVLDVHNLRDDAAAGIVPSSLAARVANTAARLWAPPDVGGAAPPENPFKDRVSEPASIPTPIALGPKGVAVVNESVDPDLEPIAMVTFDRNLLVAAIEVPAFTPPNVDLGDPDVRALLLTADGQADSALARASAVAALTNLGATGMTATGVRITSGGRGASVPAGARTAPVAGHISATVPSAMTVAGIAPASATQIGYAGQIRSYGGPLGIVTNGFEATDKNTIQYLGSEPANPGTTTVVKVKITSIGPGNAAGRLPVEPGYEWFVVVVETEEAAGQPAYPWGKNGYRVICQGGVDNKAALLGPFGSAALKAKFGEPTSVQCFALPSIDGGLVLGASDRVAVVLPGYGPDTDQDGVPDDDDKCPADKEDRDRVQDTDGCPETDADADTVRDDDDECPETAGPSPTGCPPLDTDLDGIPDFKDKCPSAPEDIDKVVDGDGCPEFDGDNDGIRDEADKCPEEAEDIEGYQDDDGCREEDSDGDGIANVVDRCLYTGEIVNNYLDTDGCPDQAPVLTVAASFLETVTGTDLKSFASSLAMVFNPATGDVSGVLSGVGEADVTFTCYEIANPSNIYDKATAHYVVSYQAPLSGSGGVGLDAPKKFTLKIAPAVTLKSTVTQFYTHDQCTHLNPSSGTKVEHADGSGTLTVAIDPLGGTQAVTKWSSSAGNVVGAYSGIAELSPADP
jgi:hypothetical protein